MMRRELTPIARRLVELRRSHNLTQEQTAGELGASVVTIGNWERGYAVPNLYSIIDLCVLYGVSPNELLGWDGENGNI